MEMKEFLLSFENKVQAYKNKVEELLSKYNSDDDYELCYYNDMPISFIAVVRTYSLSVNLIVKIILNELNKHLCLIYSWKKDNCYLTIESNLSEFYNVEILKDYIEHKFDKYMEDVLERLNYLINKIKKSADFISRTKLGLKILINKDFEHYDLTSELLKELSSNNLYLYILDGRLHIGTYFYASCFNKNWLNEFQTHIENILNKAKDLRKKLVEFIN